MNNDNLLPYLAKLDAKLDKLDGRIDSQIAKLDAKMDKLDGRIDKIDGTLNRMNVTLGKQQVKLEVLERSADLNQAKFAAVSEKVSSVFTVIYVSKWALGCSAVMAVGIALTKFLVRA